MQGLATAMDWKPEQRPLGELGLARIWLEILRVLHAIPPGFKNPGHLLVLFPHVAVSGVIFSGLVSGGVPFLLRLIFSGKFFFIVLLDLICLEIYQSIFALSVGTLYRTKGAVRGAAPNIDMLTRHVPTFFLAVALVGGCVAVTGDVWRALGRLHAPPLLHLLGGGACLAGTAYIALVCQLACVVSVLEDASGLGAIRRSRTLLFGGGGLGAMRRRRALLASGRGDLKAAFVLGVLNGYFFLAALLTIRADLWDDTVKFDNEFHGAVIKSAYMTHCEVVVVVTLVALPVVYRVLSDGAASQELPASLQE